MKHTLETLGEVQEVRNTRARRRTVAMLAAASTLVVFSLVAVSAQDEKGPTAPNQSPEAIRLVLDCGTANPVLSDAQLATTEQILRARLAKLGLDTAVVQREGANQGRFIVTLPAEASVERVKRLLTFAGRMELRPIVAGTRVPYLDKESAESAPGEAPNKADHEIAEYEDRNAEGPQRGWVILEKQVLVGNGDVVESEVARGYGGYGISFALTAAAAERLAEWTGGHIGAHLAIVLDGVVKSAPRVNGRIGDKGEISGNFTQSQAEDLAIALQAGALPSPVKVVREERISPKK